MSDALRNEFKVWLSMTGRDKYPEGITSALWMGWRASRSALEIDLSPAEVNTYDGGAYLDACKVEEILEAAGLKVKP